MVNLLQAALPDDLAPAEAGANQSPDSSTERQPGTVEHTVESASAVLAAVHGYTADELHSLFKRGQLEDLAATTARDSADPEVRRAAAFFDGWGGV